MKNQDLVERIIVFAKSNDAGILLSKEAIEAVLEVCDRKSKADQIDKLIQEHQTDSGYLVNVSDFIEVLKKPKKKEPKLHRKEFSQFLECEFTQKELLEFSKELSRKLIEIGEVENRKKSAMSQFKSEIDILVTETNELSHKINSGSEERNVKCEKLYFYDKNEKHIIRLDTGLVLWHGPIPENEQQIEMELEDREVKYIPAGGNTNTEERQPEHENIAIDARSSDAEGSDIENEQADGEGQETETIQDKTIEEQQAELDTEDEEIAEEIAENLSKSKEEDGSLPPLPNE